MKVITFLLLTILPIAVLVRDWKFNDKRTKKHHNITRVIVIFWFVGSIAATIFVGHDSAQIKELIDGKNTLISQNNGLSAKLNKYQKDLQKKEEEMKKLKILAQKDIYCPLATDIRNNLINRLKEFYQSIENPPVIIIITEKGSKSLTLVADELVTIFKNSGFKTKRSMPIQTFTKGKLPSIRIKFHPDEDQSDLQSLADLLQPFLKTKFHAKKVLEQKKGTLTIVIYGEPLFLPNGTVFFK